MRLFTAINFSGDTKNELFSAVERVRLLACGGSFTRRDNLHLTLAFIGETDRTDAVIQAMELVSAKPFVLSTGSAGCFKRDEGDLWWLGFEENSSLSALYLSVYGQLVRAGFSIDTRAYTPHLTLGRKVAFRGDFNRNEVGEVISPLKIKIDRISLMKSERIKGLLTYNEIYQKVLEET